MTINAGKLRHRINLLVQSDEKDSFGERLGTYVSVGSSIPCKVGWESGQLDGDGAVQTKVRLKIQMRRRSIPDGAVVEYAGVKYTHVFTQEVSPFEQLTFAEAIT